MVKHHYRKSKNNITGIYHGFGKREMPLFLNEQEYRFNHRYTGKEMFNKVKEYLQISFPITHKQIVNVLDQTYNPTNPSLLKMSLKKNV